LSLMLLRADGRRFDEIREIRITKDFLKYPEGSVLIEMGHTKVICTATIEDSVPPFLRNTGRGWLTAEYSCSPCQRRSGHHVNRQEDESGEGPMKFND
jgi:ribonuclease PH